MKKIFNLLSIEIMIINMYTELDIYKKKFISYTFIPQLSLLTYPGDVLILLYKFSHSFSKYI